MDGVKIMKHYINKDKEIFGFELDGSQDHLITPDMVEISLEEIQAINQAKEDEYKNSIEFKLLEASQYLGSTDYYYPRFLETGEPVPEDVVIKRTEARAFIRANEVI